MPQKNLKTNHFIYTFYKLLNISKFFSAINLFQEIEIGHVVS